jgi:AraC family transcriptional regulator, exoenzyme S synthesis regulatory protein ExsA
MLNLYDSVRSNPAFNKLEIGDLLFAEYTCPVGAEKLAHWAHSDYLVHVISGKKTWHTTDGVWEANAGETLFFKKGASIIEQFFEVDFCLLMFFIPDNLIRATVRELAGSLGAFPARLAPMKSAARVENDTALSAFFQSMRTYFSGREKPSEPLLRLKLKELIVGILTSGRNPALAAYFRTMELNESPSVAEMMELNFRYNLSLDEYAKLCHRSLSAFKRAFRAQYRAAPGHWLRRKRLDYAAGLLRGSKLSVTEIAFESGFEDVSHFSRVFKDQFRVPPMSYRQTVPARRVTRTVK